MNETTKNFMQVMQEFEWPASVAVSYRLYYNDDGSPKCYSMEQIPGKYIEVDCHTYALRPWNIKIVNDKLTYIAPEIIVKKLVPDTEQGISCSANDICVVVSDKKPHMKWKLIQNATS